MDEVQRDRKAHELARAYLLSFDGVTPDILEKKILSALGLSSSEHDYVVFKAIVRMARNISVTPYAVDRVFWLTGSGSFFRTGLEFGSHRDEFIACALEQLD